MAATEAASPGRLWTPWRMRYVGGGARETGCVFCNRLAAQDDAESLILHRGPRAFIIMNLFPYNTGHCMIVPNAHVASPEETDLETANEMAHLRAPLLRALRRAISPEGFNLGLNVGSVAGAGITDHLHEHVVPRWEGDANFMPILASTMVMPELIPVTYAKLRAEISRELGQHAPAACVVLSHDRRHMLLDEGGRLRRVAAEDGEPLWRAALRMARDHGARDPEILGWAGHGRADAGPAALLMQSTPDTSDAPPEQPGWAPVTAGAAGPDAEMIELVLARAPGA